MSGADDLGLIAGDRIIVRSPPITRRSVSRPRPTVRSSTTAGPSRTPLPAAGDPLREPGGRRDAERDDQQQSAPPASSNPPTTPSRSRAGPSPQARVTINNDGRDQIDHWPGHRFRRRHWHLPHRCDRTMPAPHHRHCCERCHPHRRRRRLSTIPARSTAAPTRPTPRAPTASSSRTMRTGTVDQQQRQRRSISGDRHGINAGIGSNHHRRRNNHRVATHHRPQRLRRRLRRHRHRSTNYGTITGGFTAGRRHQRPDAGRRAGRHQRRRRRRHRCRWPGHASSITAPFREPARAATAPTACRTPARASRPAAAPSPTMPARRSPASGLGILIDDSSQGNAPFLTTITNDRAPSPVTDVASASASSATSPT